MCADPACDSDQPPPPGEAWCPQRLRIEVVRWYTGWPMQTGPQMDLRPQGEEVADRYYRASLWTDTAGYGTLWACAECGLHVDDLDKHTKWHDDLAQQIADLTRTAVKPLRGGW